MSAQVESTARIGRGTLHVPRIMLAAPRSGEGKTTVTLALTAALVRRGMAVGSAKVGPDFIDGAWHSRLSGAPAHNLDPWLMGPSGVLRSLEAAGDGRGIVVVEGVMGLHDGAITDPRHTSSAAVAVMTDTPIILVLDASGSASTLAAVALGLARFDPDADVAGVILNRFREGRDRTAVESAFERVGIPVLGWVPTSAGVTIPERAFGLDEEPTDSYAFIPALADLAERYIDIDRIVGIASFGLEEGVVDEGPDATTADAPADRVMPVIAVAADAAFSFMYPANLEALEAAGARVERFSPLHDDGLPEGVDGLYIGGGRAEEHAQTLAANARMLTAIREAVAKGIPTYAEGAGFAYLTERVVDPDGRSHEMIGAIRGEARRSEKLTRVGYREATVIRDSIIGPAGTVLRGHEFRYSEASTAGGDPAYTVGGEPCGVATDTLLASYLHLHFGGCPEVAASLVDNARRCAVRRIGMGD